jgi:hypothetical protein
MLDWRGAPAHCDLWPQISTVAVDLRPGALPVGSADRFHLGCVLLILAIGRVLAHIAMLKALRNDPTTMRYDLHQIGLT